MCARERFLVTGGAGFIGSHMVLALIARGAEVVVFDNLSTGHAAAVPPAAQLIRADLLDRHAVASAVGSQGWDGVFHFAALSVVGESMRQPFRYLRENVVGGLNLIEACASSRVKRFILSSTANLFDTQDAVPITHDAPVRPSSPYGQSKHILEQVLYWSDCLHGMRYACLRYFNAAGADPHGRAGEDHRPETHLIPSAIDAALGRRPPLAIFGDDYPTPDGTNIRDYVHVSDLVQAHLEVLPFVAVQSRTLNVGTGQGYSVREVVATVERIVGLRVPVQTAPRRAGDPPMLIADARALRDLTGWTPQYDRLDELVRTAYMWRLKHPQGYG